MKKETKRRHLTIFLIKDDVNEIRDAVSKTVLDGSIQDISIDKRSIGLLVTSQGKTSPPDWLKYFSELDQFSEIDLKTKHASAVLLLEAAGRYFAITFGYGRFLIEQEFIERNFGLKVVLNTVPPEKIRSIDKAELEQNEIHSRDQASQATDIGDFGINIDRDILRAVSGTPAPAYSKLGNTISGADSFVCVTNQPVGKLKPLLKEILTVYRNTNYKANYPWVDNIVFVKDKNLVEQLDSVLVDKLNTQTLDNIWMAVPEIVDWAEIDGFTFNTVDSALLKNDVVLEDFLNIFRGSSISASDIEKTKVYALRAENASPYKRWSAYECLHAEIYLNNKLYLLSTANWYEINKEFAQEISAFIKSVTYNAIVLPPWKVGLSEQEYNHAVANSDLSYALMDRILIKATGAKSRIEFCDLAGINKDIIHVKRYGQSAVLSHLFNQGTVSAELLISDQTFRADLQSKLPDSHSYLAPISQPHAGDYTITYAIGSHVIGVLKLPFFSQIALRQVIRFLQGTLGFKVNLTKIDINSEYI